MREELAENERTRHGIRHMLRDRLTALGWSQRKLAAASGLYPPHVSDLLSGKTDMRATTAERMIRAMGGRFAGGAIEWSNHDP